MRRVASALDCNHSATREIEAHESPSAPARPKKPAGKRGGNSRVYIWASATKCVAGVVRGETHYEVSRFEASKYVGGKLQFLVKFEGLPKAEWLPAKQLQEDLSPDAYRVLRRR